MTTQERVNNILSLCDVDTTLLKPGVFDAIVAEIVESEREAFVKASSIYVTASNAYVEGFNAAKERAKGIAENVRALPMDEGNDPCHCVEYELTPSMIADRIGKMGPE